jgi:hypothetical protein
MPRRTDLAHAVRDVIAELARGGGAGTVPVLSQDVEVRRAFLDAFGILYVDLGGRVGNAVTEDSGRAELAFAAIVLTLTTNFSEIKRVQFLAEGREWTARVGGADLRRPLQPHFPSESPQPPEDQTPQGGS